MTQNIVATGSTYRIFDESVKVHNYLPVGTYKVRFNPMAGFSLQKIEDLRSNGEKAYGTLEKRVKKIIRTFQDTTRSLGVLASGDKGMGKTMMLRILAEKARVDLNLPVVIVDSNAPGLPDFLDTIGESVVVFDEFEKTFRIRPDDDQAQFLGLFDGMSATKRMYVVTINDLRGMNDYLINRPGRFHYHLRFEYPVANEIREYLGDNGVSSEQIENVVGFSNIIKVNYDHLRAIAFELRNGEDFQDVISDLNIKRFDNMAYKVSLKFDSGSAITTIVNMNLGSRGETASFVVRHKGTRIYGYIHTDMVQISERGVSISADAVEFDRDDLESSGLGSLIDVSASIDRSSSIDFGASVPTIPSLGGIVL